MTVGVVPNQHEQQQPRPSGQQPSQQQASSLAGGVSDEPRAPFAVVAGFGIPGRAVAECLAANQVPYCVIDANAEVVERCARGGTSIICGDARDPAVLIQAGIERATLIVIAIPLEAVSLDVVATARRLNPRALIVARCTFTSSGLLATQRGANDVVVAEQTVAMELHRVVHARLEAQR